MESTDKKLLKDFVAYLDADLVRKKQQMDATRARLREEECVYKQLREWFGSLKEGE